MKTNPNTSPESIDGIEPLAAAFRLDKEIINRFIQLVEQRAEDKMLKTGKLERPLRRHERIAEGDQPDAPPKNRVSS